MKRYIIAMILCVTTANAYEVYPMQNWCKERAREINEEFDRIDERVYRGEILRVQNEILKSIRDRNEW
jgi:hypothetical protein